MPFRLLGCCGLFAQQPTTSSHSLYGKRRGRVCSLTDAVRADLWPGTLVALPGGLRGLPEDAGIPRPGGNAAAAQTEASLTQTEKAFDYTAHASAGMFQH